MAVRRSGVGGPRVSSSLFSRRSASEPHPLLIAGPSTLRGQPATPTPPAPKEQKPRGGGVLGTSRGAADSWRGSGRAVEAPRWPGPRTPRPQRKGARGPWQRQKRGRTDPGGGAEGTLGPLGLTCLGSRPSGPSKLSQGRPPPGGLGKGAAVSSGRVAQGAPAEDGRGTAVRGGSETQATAATTGRRPSTARSFPEHLAAPAPVPASHPHPPGARSTPTPGLPCWPPSRLHPPALGSFTHPQFSVPSFPPAQS